MGQHAIKMPKVLHSTCAYCHEPRVGVQAGGLCKGWGRGPGAGGQEGGVAAAKAGSGSGTPCRKSRLGYDT